MPKIQIQTGSSRRTPLLDRPGLACSTAPSADSARASRECGSRLPAQGSSPLLGVPSTTTCSPSAAATRPRSSTFSWGCFPVDLPIRSHKTWKRCYLLPSQATGGPVTREPQWTPEGEPENCYSLGRSTSTRHVFRRRWTSSPVGKSRWRKQSSHRLGRPVGGSQQVRLLQHLDSGR